MGADDLPHLGESHHARLCDAANRLDELSEAAALMGDDDGAVRLRDQAHAMRSAAMRLLDD